MIGKYEKYLSPEMVTVPQSRLFTDKDGFPNDVAFKDFCSLLTGNEGLIIICLIFDVSVSNIKGYKFGTTVMKKLYNQLKDDYYVFRYSGNKFNILAKPNEIENLKAMFDTCPKNFATIYYGIVEECIITNENYEEQRKIGIERMYKHKMEATLSKMKTALTIEDRKCIPTDYQESKTHKPINTMWYGLIKFEEKEPLPHSLTAYIYPTEYSDYPAPLNMIVVLDDKINRRIFTGTNVTIGFDGNRFDINSRIDKNGNLIIQCFPSRDNKGIIDVTKKKHEGQSLPLCFGKQISNDTQIFPVRPNSYGSYDYVIWNRSDKTAEYNTTGLVNADNQIYTVTFNKSGIELVEYSM